MGRRVRVAAKAHDGGEQCEEDLDLRHHLEPVVRHLFVRGVRHVAAKREEGDEQAVGGLGDGARRKVDLREAPIGTRKAARSSSGGGGSARCLWRGRADEEEHVAACDSM